MFGDTFGTKSDYSKGMLYSVRNTYAPKGGDSDEIVIAPPDSMFLSRDQARNKSTPAASTQDFSNVLDFTSPTKTDNDIQVDSGRSSPSTPASRKIFKNGKTFKNFDDINVQETQDHSNSGAAILSNFKNSSRNNKSAKLKENAKKNAERKAAELALQQELEKKEHCWELVEQAGARFYHNRYTGEARADNPKEDDKAIGFDELEVTKPRIEEGMGHGEREIATGAIVYDQLKPEFDHVMSFLEGKCKTYE